MDELDLAEAIKAALTELGNEGSADFSDATLRSNDSEGANFVIDFPEDRFLVTVTRIA